MAIPLIRWCNVACCLLAVAMSTSAVACAQDLPRPGDFVVRPSLPEIPPLDQASAKNSITAIFGAASLGSTSPRAEAPRAAAGVTGQLLADGQVQKSDVPADSNQAGVAPYEPSWPDPPSLGSVLARLAFGTLLILGVCVGTLWYGRRWLQKNGAIAACSSQQLKLVETTRLGTHCAVHLLQIGDQRILAGTDRGGLHSLVPLPESFGDLFQKQSAREVGPELTPFGIGEFADPLTSRIPASKTHGSPGVAARFDSTLLSSQQDPASNQLVETQLEESAARDARPRVFRTPVSSPM